MQQWILDLCLWFCYWRIGNWVKIVFCISYYSPTQMFFFFLSFFYLGFLIGSTWWVSIEWALYGVLAMGEWNNIWFSWLPTDSLCSFELVFQYVLQSVGFLKLLWSSGLNVIILTSFFSFGFKKKGEVSDA